MKMDLTRKEIGATLERLKQHSANVDNSFDDVIKKRLEATAKQDWLIRVSGIRNKFLDVDFDSYEFSNEAQRTAFETVREYAGMKGSLIVLLYGKSGTGKTMLASCAVKQQRGFYTTYEWLAIRIRSSYSRASSETEAGILKQVTTAPLLVLDEIDKGTNTDAKKDLISFVCRERYENELPTWLVGNLTWEWAKQNIDSSVLDRCKEGGKSILCDWESYRDKLRTGGDKNV